MVWGYDPWDKGGKWGEPYDGSAFCQVAFSGLQSRDTEHSKQWQPQWVDKTDVRAQGGGSNWILENRYICRIKIPKGIGFFISFT